MGNLTLNGATSGQITISPPAVAGSNTITLPAATGTIGLVTVISNPTQTIYTSGSGTYTVPTGVKWLRVRMVGGGGGGGGGGWNGSSSGTGGTGGTTTFGSATVTGGIGGVNSSQQGFGGSGGTVSAVGSISGFSITGGSGASALNQSISAQPAGSGGNCPIGFGGGGSANSSTGQNGTGYGGGGGGAGTTAANLPGDGGGAGGYLEGIITSPAATYSYAVGAAGTAGTAGTSGGAGGAGASGAIIIEEHYNY